MKNTLKFTSAIIAAAILSISGCSNNNNATNTSSGNNTTEAPAANAEQTTAEEPKTEKVANGFDIDAYIANYTPKTELTNSGLFDYEVKINGAVLTCPISTAEIAALGYEPKEAYTINIEPNTLSELRSDARFYINKTTGVELVFEYMSTTSNESFTFDSDSPRDDVLFYDLNVNTNESYWEHDKAFTVEFYGGTVTNYDSQYNGENDIITSESELKEKCGDYSGKDEVYYEFPEDDNAGRNSVMVWINEEKNISGIRFRHYLDKVKPDKSTSQTISHAKQ